MTPEELRALLTPEGLRLLDEVGAVTADADVVRIVSRLRAAGHSPALVAAVLTQARLRTRARSRFHEFADRDRKSTRLNSSHVKNSYAVCCLKRKNRVITGPPSKP